MPTVLLSCAAVLLAALIACEKADRPLLRLGVKTALSALFLVAALHAGQGFSRAFTLLFTGLCLCFAGDVLLAVPARKAFPAGLFCFLLGHLFYAACFLSLSGPNAAFAAGLAACLALGVLVMRRLLPYLGKMRVPVALYVAVISLMLAAACALAQSAPLPSGTRALAFFGAFFFYVSDIFVARHRFVRKSFYNRLAGLPLYYSGQFMLAFFGAAV